LKTFLQDETFGRWISVSPMTGWLLGQRGSLLTSGIISQICQRYLITELITYLPFASSFIIVCLPLKIFRVITLITSRPQLVL